MFEIGQQVVCIKEGWFHPLLREVPNLPVLGRIYTIRGFDVWNSQFFFLEEIVNPKLPNDCAGGLVEPSFLIYHFRPVRKTDIGIFTEMLVPVQPKKLERV